MEQAKVDKVLGLKEALRIFKKGKAMHNLVHDDNVIKLEINNNNYKQKIYNSWCNISFNSLGQRPN